MIFGHFGCWNNMNGKLIDNMNFINSEEIGRVDFFSVAGDNYYPVKKDEKGGKEKTIFEKDLRQGFDLLPMNQTDKFMILGNHDLETDLQYVDKDGNKIEKETECKILELEQEIANKSPDIFLNLFKFYFDSKTRTLLIFFDTTMYVSEKFKKFQKCYERIIPGNIIGKNTSKSKGKSNMVYQEALIEYQNQAIMDYISRRGKITNLVLIGHHPLIYLKRKKSDESFKQDIPKVSGLLGHIHDLCPDSKFFYLCADLHLYQEGDVEFSHGDKTMKIKQYIVGTGGTDLDDNITGKPAPKTIGAFKYTHKETIRSHGFLLCDFTGEPLFDFKSLTDLNTPPKKRSQPPTMSPKKESVANPGRPRSISPTRGGRLMRQKRKVTRKRKN